MILDEGGRNNYGQLGNRRTNDSNTPVSVSNITNAVHVVAGDFYTCALLENKTVKCWGDNYYGQLGNKNNMGSSIPVKVSGINTAIQISASRYHTCAVLENNTIKCWGSNFSGKLGYGKDGVENSSNRPVEVQNGNTGRALSTAVRVGAGDDHTCSILKNGKIKCWGRGTNGQLGTGALINSNTPKLPSMGINNSAENQTKNLPVQVVAGFYYSCARFENGTIKCWGTNDYGQLADNSSGSSIPVQIPISGAIQMSAGFNHACALSHEKREEKIQQIIRCWGGNNYGQLGNGTTTNNPTPPIPVGVIDNENQLILQVSAGYGHTCALLSEPNEEMTSTIRKVKCWGYNNYGQLGNGTRTWRRTPVLVSDF